VFKLTIEDDEGKTTVVPLARDEMTIGRQEGNTIRLTERNVSRRHARLSRQNGVLYIEDLASFTGVRVNGAKIASPTPLRDGDEVLIGDYRILLRAERPAASDRATVPSMPIPLGPMATLGGTVAIPTRASIAAMAAQPAPLPPAAPAAGDSRPRKTPPVIDVAVVPVASAETDGAPVAVEGQPTRPFQALDGDQAGFALGLSGRLVVLTTDLVGTELTLDRPSLVIGRTDENDLVLDHRSISRHHAKIVRDDDRYTIVDLQSANGVRVNGEDYERIELNAGDVIELGHVKLRFIGPDEPFVFDPQVAIIPRRLPMKWVAAGAAGAVLAALVLVMVHKSSRDAFEPPPAAPSASSAQQPTPAPPPAQSRTATLTAVKRAVAAENWDAARAALDRLREGSDDSPEHPELTALDRKVELERESATLFARFDEAANSKDYGEALVEYDRISPESVYKKRAQRRYEEARTLLVAEHIAVAEKARAAGRCGEVRAEADAILNIDSQNMVARDLVKLCRARPEPAAVAARPARVRASPAIAEREPARRAESSRAEAPARGQGAQESADVDSLMKQARDAWLRQQCGAAMDLSRRALRAKPGLTDAYQILAVCSCSLKDADAAGRAYARLDDRNRSLVHAVCQKNGISVGE
jgi:pSer/pThr/pTyr-binding forkhead associated (FHA) protein